MSLSERDRHDISDLASAAADGIISPSDQARLEGVLRSSAEARAYYVRFMDVSAGLAWAARAEPERQAVVGRIDSGATREEGWRIAVTAVAVLALSTLGAWAFLKPVSSSPGTGTSAVGIATLSTAMNVEWANEEEPSHVGNMLRPGWVRLKSGLAQIDFFNGASVWLEGPVEFRLDSVREGYCASGKVIAQVPRGAGDFRLAAPYMSSIEKATGFGVEVNKGSSAAVHVFRGTVQVTLKENLSRTVGAGQALAIDHAGTTSMMTADPAAFSREEFNGRSDFAHPFGVNFWMYPGGEGNRTAVSGPYMGPPPVMLPGMWRGADPMDPVRDILGSTDQRWAEIKPPLEDFLKEQWKSWGLDNNLEENGVTRAKWDLKFAVENPNSTDDELARRLEGLRLARAESRKQLSSKELELLDLLTSDEQARLVSTGYIP